jgi:hypothetical protein
MINLVAGAFLMLRIACHRLDVSGEICIRLWQNRPIVEVVLEKPAQRRQRLTERLDLVYPF